MKHKLWLTTAILALCLSGCQFFHPANPSQTPDESNDSQNEQVKQPADSNAETTTAMNEGALLENFYAAQLSDHEQELYQRLEQGITQEEEMVDATGYSQEEIFRTWFALQQDKPEYYWLDSLHFQLIDDQPSAISVPVKDEVTWQRIDQAADQIINNMPQDLDDAGKVQYIYETLVNNTTYNTQAENNQDLRSVLLNHESVCAGYARAFEYLCRLAGIPCTFVSGSVLKDPSNPDSQVEHAWNLLKIGDQYYWTDPTWGEMNIEGQEDGLVYSYLLVNDDQLFRTHTPATGARFSNFTEEGTITYPAATDLSLTYFARNNLYFETFDLEAVLNAARAQITPSHPRLDIEFGSAEAYEQAKSVLCSQDSPLFQVAMENLGYQNSAMMDYSADPTLCEMMFQFYQS